MRIADEPAVAQRENQLLAKIPRVQVQERLQARERRRAHGRTSRHRSWRFGRRVTSVGCARTIATIDIGMRNQFTLASQPKARAPTSLSDTPPSRRHQAMAREGSRPAACFTRAKRSSSANATSFPSRNRQAAGWTTSVAPKTPRTFTQAPRVAAPTVGRRREHPYSRRSSPSSRLQTTAASRSRSAERYNTAELRAIAPERRLLRASAPWVEEDLDVASDAATTQMFERGADMRKSHHSGSQHADERLGGPRLTARVRAGRARPLSARSNRFLTTFTSGGCGAPGVSGQ